MGIGYGTGDSRAAEAARAAVDSPLLELSINGAKGILFNITGGNDLSMFEVDEAARIITETAAPEANIIFGAVIDDAFTGQVKCTVIATGFDAHELTQVQSFQSPSQRYLTKAAGSAPAARPAPDMRSQREERPMMQEPVKNGLQLDEEELEVPAFMRKTIGK
jgi:cell division protein FtsZ